MILKRDNQKQNESVRYIQNMASAVYYQFISNIK